MLEVARCIASNFLLCIAVTCSGDKDGGVDDQAAEFFEYLTKAWEDLTGRPDVWAEIFRECLGG